MVIFVIYISAFSSFISSAVIPVISMIVPRQNAGEVERQNAKG